MYQYIEYIKQEGIAHLVFNRPESRNAINQEMRQEIVEALQDARLDTKVAVLLISANGKSFCAGRDMKEVGKNKEATMAEVYEDYALGKEFLDQFQIFPKPIIAAVNGHALGYGTSIVSYCDLVLAGRSATFGYPEIRNNIVPSTAAVKSAEVIGKRKFAEMVLLGNHYGAEEAKEMGLINDITEDEDLLERALSWARQLAQNDPMTNEMCRQFLRSLDLPGYNERALGAIGILGMGFINKNKR